MVYAGEVQVSAHLEVTAKQLQLHIRDTGAGASPQQLLSGR